ncbi:hypothetical protein CK203_108203 [Vitis vinifera]|uniref:Uncharacterized protein n=1 Tax=Vitis vinifera TaxID=29760 RepID=A0A438CPW1_VITVI|nr:hypothetical protein CK203_108203 [Vitis vinifera]
MRRLFATSLSGEHIDLGIKCDSSYWKPKIPDVLHCTGSGGIDTSTVVKAIFSSGDSERRLRSLSCAFSTTHL